MANSYTKKETAILIANENKTNKVLRPNNVKYRKLMKRIDRKKKGNRIINSIKEHNYNADSSFSAISRLLSIVVCFLIIVALARALMGQEPIYFSSFLEGLANAPSTTFALSMPKLYIDADWGIFEFFRNLLNSFGSIIQLLLFIVNGLVNLVSYLLYFVGFFFGV